ncbi:MAG: hypothetical protein GVY32_10255 [Gammaproteobacteria bacterium]|jgi:hypothetical protein|nr:hypothetical protein [Gammaproteobacteria bacterium]
MKTKKKLLAAALAAAICMPVAADDHEDDGNQMLSIMDLSIQHGHGMQFREAMTAYMDCYVENGGTNEWSTWAAVDGEPNRMMIVSNIEMWAELDADDPGDEACWPEHGPELTSHVSSANRQMFRRMPDWSGDAEGYTVVQLHNFRVEDGEAFSEVVGEMVGMMKDAEYEHMGTWYDAVGNQRWAADYFVVDHYENFAAMDEDRKGVNGVMVDALGEEGAAEIWDRFGDTLADMEPYWTLTLRRVDSLSHMASDE